MKTYIVGNWKLNFTVDEASHYLRQLNERLPIDKDIEVVVAPSTVALYPLSQEINQQKLHLAAQDASEYDFGPHTGETAFAQLRSLVDYCILGHSERRSACHEDDKKVHTKLVAALQSGITPVLCLGETAQERDSNQTTDVLKRQLLSALEGLTGEDLARIILAYEPVWAISGHPGAKQAEVDDIAPTLELIRSILALAYDEKTASSMSLLYGGSVSPDNAESYLSLADCNGLLIGSASLILDRFLAIIEIAKRLKINE